MMQPLRTVRAHLARTRAVARGHAALVAGLVTLAGLVSAQGSATSELAPGRRATTFQGQGAVDGELLVRFHLDVDEHERAGLHTTLAARQERDLQRGWVHVSFEGRSIGEAIEAYRSDSRVAEAEPNWLRYPAYTPDDPKLAANQWAPQKVNAEAAWALQDGDASIVIAVIDSGVDSDHPDLAGDMAWGWDFFGNDSNPNDADGHGTHVCGIAAAETDNGTGVAGMGFHCRFAAYRCGNTSFPLSATIASINDATAQGAHVINMSYGSSAFSTAERDAIKAAHQAGVVPVAAAGNDGSDAKHYPAAYARVIAVANSTQSDNRNSSSNYGDWVAVAAPGTQIHSTHINAGYANKWGTSMASPLVAGLAGLLYAELGGARSEANATLIRQAMENSSVPVSYVEHGRIDALGALFEISPPAAPTLTGTLPAQIDAFFGSELLIQGTSLASASQIDIGGTVHGPASFEVVDDFTLRLTPQNAPALGPVDVTVTTLSGSATTSFEYVETSPPVLQMPPIGVPGSPFTAQWAGGADNYYVFLWSTGGATVPFLGFDVLLDLQIGEIGTFDALGHRSATFPSLGSFGLLTLHFQVVDVDELSAAIVGTTSVESVIFL